MKIRKDKLMQTNTLSGNNTLSQGNKSASSCPICYEGLSPDIPPFSCGHTMHMACVQQHFRPECPLCRASLPITVYGIIPREENISIPMNWRETLREEDNYFTSGPFSQPDEMYDSDDSMYSNSSKNSDSNPIYRQKGFLHREEDLDNWDEENSRGDEVEYSP